MATRRFLGYSALLALLLCGCQPPASSAPAAPSDNPPPAPASQPVIALFTDFGLSDPYVAQMKGAIVTIDPNARLLDLTHDVTPYDVAEGAYLLDQSAEDFPAGTIFVAVVDPGAGTDHAPILLKSGAGKYYLAPDNGLLGRVIDREGFASAWKLDQSSFFRSGSGTQTFPGGDIFGPVAAHLAAGTDPAKMGSLLSEKALDLPSLHEPAVAGRIVSAEVLHVDHNGNVILNLRNDGEAGGKLKMGDLVKITIGKESFAAPLVSTYAEAEKGRMVLLYGSNGLLEIAMSQGSAAAKMKVMPGTPVLLKP